MILDYFLKLNGLKATLEVISKTQREFYFEIL